MWNLFEQPWTLVGAAIFVLLGVLTFRGVWEEKRRWWQWLLPIGLAAIGFGLDFAVATNRERINHTIRGSMKAAEQEDCVSLGPLIAADYKDSFHKDKQALLDHCRTRLVSPAIQQIKTVGKAIEISPPQGTVTLTVKVRFEQESYWVRSYGKTAALVKARFQLRKQPDGNWLVTRIEVLDVDMIPVNWGLAKRFCAMPPAA